MRISQKVFERLNIPLPRLPGWLKPGIVGFIGGFVGVSLLDLYIIYVFVSSDTSDDILQRKDLLLFATVVFMLVLLYFPASLLTMWSNSIFPVILLGNMSIGFVVGGIILLFQELRNDMARLALLISLGILLLILLSCSMAGSFFVIAGLAKDW